MAAEECPAAAAARRRVAALQKEAEEKLGDIHVDSNAPLKRYFAGAAAALTQGRQYLQQGDDEKAYTLIFRFVTFILQLLPKHAAYKKPESAADRKKYEKYCFAALGDCEQIKARLLLVYQAEEAERIARESAQREAEATVAAPAASIAASVSASEAHALADAASATSGSVSNDCPGDLAVAFSSAVLGDHHQPQCSPCGEQGYDKQVPPVRAMYPVRYEPPTRRRELDSGAPLPPNERHQSIETAAPHTGYGHMYPSIQPPRNSFLAQATRTMLPIPPVTPMMSSDRQAFSIDATPGLGAPVSLPGETRQQPRAYTASRQAAYPPTMYPTATYANATYPSAQPPAYQSSVPPIAPTAYSTAYSPVTPPTYVPASRPSFNPPSFPTYSPACSSSGAPPLNTSVAVPTWQPRPQSFTAEAPGAFANACGCAPSSLVSAAETTSARSRLASTPSSKLRPLILPESLSQNFLSIAAANTAKGIETCGILVGSLQLDAARGQTLCVDRLIVPSQEGDANSCTTTNEDEIWEYCEREQVMTLGWVHTHPTQTCFLSSVDLHTHCGYQSMLDEAVAVVLSPRKSPSVGVYRLCHPDPPGLQEVQRCRKTGFHPEHQRNGPDANNGVYEDCAHIVWRPSASLKVVDLRR